MYLLNYSLVVDRLLRDIRVYITEFSEMKSGDKILDVCCGTGDQAFHYARKGITATGIDQNPGFIKLAGRNKEKQRTGNISFQLAAAQDLPYEDNSFDCASISLALHENEMAAIDRIITEMKRVVRKDGSLILMDFRVPLPEGLFFYFINAIEFTVGRDNYRNFKSFIRHGGLKGILKRNHLTEVKRDDMNHRIFEIIKTVNV